jgi:hypothetical protein
MGCIVHLTYAQKKHFYEQGGKIVFLTDFDERGLSLRAFIHEELSRVASPRRDLRKSGPTSKRRHTRRLSLRPNDLLVFIDDTGHETFAGNQGFYGLGG